MWSHHTKLKRRRVENLHSWLRAAVSLLVVMSLTWILGILIVKIKELFPLAYIYTIMVAFQGFFIFLIFVVFSSLTRAAYSKWWKLRVKHDSFLIRDRMQTVSAVMVSSTRFIEPEMDLWKCGIVLIHYRITINDVMTTNGDVMCIKV